MDILHTANNAINILNEGLMKIRIEERTRNRPIIHVPRFTYKRLFSRCILCAMRNFMPWQFSSCTGFDPERVETQSSSWSVSLYMIFFFRIIWRWQGNMSQDKDIDCLPGC